MAYLHDIKEVGICNKMLVYLKRKESKKTRAEQWSLAKEVISYQEGDCNSIAASEYTLQQAHRGYC